jgi:hypothetical protein
MTQGRRHTPNVPDPQQHQPVADPLEGSLEVLGPILVALLIVSSFPRF